MLLCMLSDWKGSPIIKLILTPASFIYSTSIYRLFLVNMMATTKVYFLILTHYLNQAECFYD